MLIFLLSLVNACDINELPKLNYHQFKSLNPITDYVHRAKWYPTLQPFQKPTGSFERVVIKCSPKIKGPYDKLRHEICFLDEYKSKHFVEFYGVIDTVNLCMVTREYPWDLEDFVREHYHEQGYLQEATYLANELVKAVAQLHALGYLHLDIKPSNILTDGRHIKLTDFEYVRQVGSRGKQRGTGPFLSPKLVHADDRLVTYTKQDDIFSLGVTLSFLFTKRYPFDNQADLGQGFFNDVEERMRSRLSFDRIPYAFQEKLREMLKMSERKRMDDLSPGLRKPFFEYPTFSD